VPIDTVMPAITLALAVGMLAIFMLPGFMTDYRAKGILRRLSTTPVHPARLLGAQVAVQAAIGVAALPLTLALGLALGMDAPQNPAALLLALLVGGAALFSLGLLVSALAPDARIGWVFSAVLFFPSVFLAGFWLQKEQMPDWLARAGELTPLGGFRTAVQDAWTGAPLDPLILLSMALTAVVVGALAARVFRWE
jgi:ABC-2 type transport system permease protein